MVTTYCNLLYICSMKRRIITFGRYFGEFMKGLTDKEREKVDYGLVLLKTQDRLRITGKSMCLGIDIRQSEQEVFNI